MLDTVVFDLGGVLIRWNPRNLYRSLFEDQVAMEDFLERVCPQSWNQRQDEGRPWSEGIAERIAMFPEYENLIRAYDERWLEMLDGAIEGTVAIVEALSGRGVPLYALSNWSAQKFALTRPMFDFFDYFDGMLISGEEGLIKPDPHFFELLTSRFGVSLSQAIFIDDSPENITACEALGMTGILFTSPDALKEKLERLGYF